MRRSVPILAALATVLSCVPGAGGQESPPTGWTNVAELTYVLTSGNASSNTLGLKSTTEYAWPRASFRIAGGAVRTESSITTRTATGTPDDFTVVEDTETETRAANYYVRARYNRTIVEGTFVFAGAGWERNTFAGVENRYKVVAGGGRTWLDQDRRRFNTDLGATYTIQDDVVEDPDIDEAFFGFQASAELLHRLTETTDFLTELVVDENLDRTADLRVDWTSSIAVAVSDNLQLKTSYQVFFDNKPALVSVPLSAGGEVLTPLEKVDTQLTLAIVATF